MLKQFRKCNLDELRNNLNIAINVTAISVTEIETKQLNSTRQSSV